MSENQFQILITRLDKMDNRLDKMDNRLGKMDNRLDKMDNRLDKIEKKVNTIEEVAIETRQNFRNQELTLTSLYSKVQDLENQVRSTKE